MIKLNASFFLDGKSRHHHGLGQNSRGKGERWKIIALLKIFSFHRKPKIEFSCIIILLFLKYSFQFWLQLFIFYNVKNCLPHHEMSHRIASGSMENKHISVKLKLESHIEYEMRQKMSINWLMKLENSPVKLIQMMEKIDISDDISNYM